MSVQFGRWNWDGKPIDPTYLAQVNRVIAPYGPDDEGTYVLSNVSILYRAFRTTAESRCEMQPHVSESGAVIAWDGRLDNRTELIRSLPNIPTASHVTDLSIVAAAYETWGASCFGKLMGDWAASIWDAKSRLLILAKDPIGTRQLYYSIGKDQVTWSTILDPLVLFAGKSLTLCEEYIAGWFAFFPAAHLTPYVGIHSVPPSSSAHIRAGKHVITKYWDFDPDKKVRHRTDTEYEEHFRAVFGEAVRRRLRSDTRILAELSGGMDSSSIVCMADDIIARGQAPSTTTLDTISYYCENDPNWDERPYFTRVEEQRGRRGCHIQVGAEEPFDLFLDLGSFSSTPGAVVNSSLRSKRQFREHVILRGARVLLSGVGGDEVLGGVPSPHSELADLLVTGKLRQLSLRLKLWALEKRKPWFLLLFETVRDFIPSVFLDLPAHQRPPTWICSDFGKRNRHAFSGYQSRLKILNSLPSFQEDLFALESLRRQLGSSPLSTDPLFEKRFPYLDRDLLEFLYAIPREQLVRPGQRRSLMRRALLGIVPSELLQRKRKAFVTRGPMLALLTKREELVEMTRHLLSNRFGIVDPAALRDILQEIPHRQQTPIVSLMRTIDVELWLRNLVAFEVLEIPGSPGNRHLQQPGSTKLGICQSPLERNEA
jgi:asparagine synthase (glutamine-hydrolysing)